MPKRVTASRAVLRAELASWRAKIDQAAERGGRAETLFELRNAYQNATAALGDLERDAPGSGPGFQAAMRALIARYREITR